MTQTYQERNPPMEFKDEKKQRVVVFGNKTLEIYIRILESLGITTLKSTSHYIKNKDLYVDWIGGQDDYESLYQLHCKGATHLVLLVDPSTENKRILTLLDSIRMNASILNPPSKNFPKVTIFYIGEAIRKLRFIVAQHLLERGKYSPIRVEFFPYTPNKLAIY